MTDVEYKTPKKEADAKELKDSIAAYKFSAMRENFESLGIILDEGGKTPPRAPEPKWYHKLFNFIPSNQRVIDNYNQSVRAHAQWEKDIAQRGEELEAKQKSASEQYKTARTIDERSGALRDEKSMAADREMSETIARAHWREQEDILRKAAGATEHGIDIMVNVYGSRPKIREEWVKKSGREDYGSGLYTEQSFNKLTPATIDIAKVEIGGKSLTEREFATLAMFGAVDADIGVAAQKAAVADPQGAIDFYKQAGYNEKQAKQIIADSISGAYTQDVLRVEGRMFKYFDTAMNGGRAKAAEALKAYQKGDKTKLAEIMGRAVKTAGGQAGVTDDTGVHPLGKVAGEMISLMERDPELKAMTKESFERAEREFCEGTPFQPRTFEEMTDSVQKMQKFSEVQERGMKARADLALARAEGRELTPEEKKGYVRDILTARLTEGLRQSQLKEIKAEKANPEGVPMNYENLSDYCDKLGEKLEEINLAVSTSGGSSLPSSAPVLLSSGMECRVVKKPDILDRVADPKKLEAIRRTVDKIIEADQLGEKSMDFLAENVIQEKSYDPYNMSKVMDAALKVNEIDKKLAQEKTANVEKNGPELESNEPQKEQQRVAVGG